MYTYLQRLPQSACQLSKKGRPDFGLNQPEGPNPLVSNLTTSSNNTFLPLSHLPPGHTHSVGAAGGHPSSGLPPHRPHPQLSLPPSSLPCSQLSLPPASPPAQRGLPPPTILTLQPPARPPSSLTPPSAAFLHPHPPTPPARPPSILTPAPARLPSILTPPTSDASLHPHPRPQRCFPPPSILTAPQPTRPPPSRPRGLTQREASPLWRGLFRPAGGRAWGGARRDERACGASVRGSRPAAGRLVMLITLCYLYLWARWGRRPAALVRATVQRLRASRCSFTFCGAAARPRGARVCLSRGGRVFCVGESQVGGRGAGGERAGPGARGEAGPAGGAASGRRLPEAPASPALRRGCASWGVPGGGAGSEAPLRALSSGARTGGPEVRNCDVSRLSPACWVECTGRHECCRSKSGD